MSETETIDPQELAAMLERNGYPSAAGRILDGEPPAEATAYIRGREPLYDDSEGRWLQAHIDSLGGDA